MPIEKRAYAFTEKAAARAARTIIRLEGKRFGQLTVLSRAGRKSRFISWLCRCDCGTEIEIGGDKLRRGKRTRCYAETHKAERPTPLTIEYKSEYQSWISMRERCTDPNHKNYKNYGSRGITIDPRWDSFKNFMLDMGRKPDPKFTIEREDVNGNYEPKNCKWISRKDQGRNRRNSVFVTYNGKRMLLIDIVEELGLSRGIVYGRLKAGWTLAQSIALPIGTQGPKGSRKKKTTSI